eukprot:scaffold4280_cov169-Ochromonas_danica.AAC.13
MKKNRKNQNITEVITAPHHKYGISTDHSVHASYRSQQECVSFIQRGLPIDNGFDNARHVLFEIEEVCQIEQKMEVTQHIHKAPSLFISPNRSREVTVSQQ